MAFIFRNILHHNQGIFHVLIYCKYRQQIKILEDKTDISTTKDRRLFTAKIIDAHAIDLYFTVIGAVQATN